jgi:mono/diheme cytochrome c family protein
MTVKARFLTALLIPSLAGLLGCDAGPAKEAPDTKAADVAPADEAEIAVQPQLGASTGAPEPPAGTAAEEASDAARRFATAMKAVDTATAEDVLAAPEPEKPTTVTKKKPVPKKTAPDSDADGPKEKPTETKAADSAKGKTVFMAKCKSCHGVNGNADTKIGKKQDIPSWKEPGWKGKWPLAKIEDIVKDGKSGTKMKAFKTKLSPEEIKAVSQYARKRGS